MRSWDVPGTTGQTARLVATQLQLHDGGLSVRPGILEIRSRVTNSLSSLPSFSHCS